MMGSLPNTVLQHKKTSTAVAISVTLVLLTLSPAAHMPWEHVPTYEDCDPDFGFYIEEATYYASNETAFIQIDNTFNMTSDRLKNFSFSIHGGAIEGENDTQILVNGEPTDGLVASTEKDAPLEFPVQPFNLTVIGGDGDDDFDGNVGFEKGEWLHRSYYWKNLKYTDYCSRGKHQQFPLLQANQTNLDKRFG